MRVPALHLSLAVFLVLCVSTRQVDLEYDGLAVPQGRYLSMAFESCESLLHHERRIQHDLLNVRFSHVTELEAHLQFSRAVQGRLEAPEFDECYSAHRLFGATITVADLIEQARSAQLVHRQNRNLFFFFDGVPDGVQVSVVNRVVHELSTMERWYAVWDLDKLPAKPLQPHALVFLITDRRILADDVGGAAVGSFIWLPLEHAPGIGGLPVGVNGEVVRHEIVHALTNQTVPNHRLAELPEEFTEGMALYVAGNSMAEYDAGVNGSVNRSRALSEDYVDFLLAFQHLENRLGQEGAYRFIRRILLQDDADFFAMYEEATGVGYNDFLYGGGFLLKRWQTDWERLTPPEQSLALLGLAVLLLILLVACLGVFFLVSQITARGH